VEDMYNGRYLRVRHVQEMHIGGRYVSALDLTTHIGPLIMPPIETFGDYYRVV
jgi:hypothetical protein